MVGPTGDQRPEVAHQVAGVTGFPAFSPVRLVPPVGDELEPDPLLPPEVPLPDEPVPEPPELPVPELPDPELPDPLPEEVLLADNSAKTPLGHTTFPPASRWSITRASQRLNTL